MKTISKLASGLALAAISGSAFAASGIAGTVHNLGSTNFTGGNYTDATTEICVFCHTPHAANQTSAGTAPLWNRQYSSASYSRYSAMGTTTFDAAEAAIGSVSIACLSCHDGTQAMDAMINSPGAGTGWTGDATVSSIAAGGMSGHGGWNETNIMSTFGLGSNDNGNAADMIFLGTDLRNDHPISMQYGGGGISNASPAAATTDLSYAPAGTGGGAVPATQSIGGTGQVQNRLLAASGQRVWYVDTNGDNTQQKDDFTLFTRGTGAAAEPMVECATCHDPHSTNGLFLRLSGGNQNSQVCLTCHTK